MFVKVVQPAKAKGDVATAYERILYAYAADMGVSIEDVPFDVPTVYQVSSLVPEHLTHFAAWRELLDWNPGWHTDASAAGGRYAIPPMLANFGVSLFSSCYY